MKKDATADYSPCFITSSEYEEFQKTNRFVSRKITAISEEQADQDDRKESELVIHVVTLLRQLVKRETNGFAGLCIGVRENDGLSWSSEAVNFAIAEKFGHIKRWAFTNERMTESMPLISQFIGVRTFLKLAVIHKLTPSYFSFISLRSWVAPLILFLAVAVGSAIKMVEVIQKMKLPGANQGLGQIFSDPAFYIINIVLAALGLGSQFLTTYLTTQTKSKSVEKLNELLLTPEKLPKLAYDDFVDSLAKQMQSAGFPRAVIIDNFEHLDNTTKLVIHRYFQKYSKDRLGLEYWIIFEKQNGERFSSLVLGNSTAYGYSNTQLFEQLVLTEPEKKKLVHLIGLPEDAVEYISIKHVCHPRQQDTEQMEAFFRDYRERHPKQAESYGELEFLFLLSLTAERDIYLTHKFILKNLTVKSGPRASVLSQFLYGTKLRIEEFRAALSEIQDKFKAVLFVKQDGDLLKLRAIPEKTDVLTEMADELELPDPKLGHLFWSLFWHDKLQNHPVEAIWMRKLARHLLKADASMVKDDQTYIDILGRLFEASLFAIEGCMKVCLFQDIKKLLETAFFLLQDEGLQKSDSDRKLLFRLLRRCWEVYSILGDEAVLKLILDIDDLAEVKTEAVEAERQDALLEKLFFESMQLSEEKRNKLNPNFFSQTYGRPQTSQSISDYVRAHSAWLVLTGSDITNHINSDVNGFITALVYSDLSVEGIWKNAFSRIDYVSEESVRLTDVMTLSLSLWCNALRFDGIVINIKLNAMKKNLANAVNSSFGDLGLSAQLPPELTTNEFYVRSWLSKVPEEFSALIDIAEDAVLLATNMKRDAAGQSQGPSGMDYMMNGLAAELCAISLASVLTAYHSLLTIGVELDDAFVTRINDGIINISNNFFNYALPETLTGKDLSSPALLSKIDTLMKLCGMIWNQFGLDHLRDFMNIRRIHFNAACRQLTPDNFSAYNSLLQSVGNTINKGDFSGLLANLTLVKALRSADELAAYYAIHTAEIALRDDFGQRLKDQLCLAAIVKGYSFAYDLGIFIQHLIAADPGQNSLLYRFLETVPEKDLTGKVLIILNLTHNTKSAETSAKIIQIVTAFMDRITSDDVKNEVKSLLEIFRSEQQIQEGQPVNIEELLASWTDRKESWLYPWLLNILIKNGHSTPPVHEAGVAVLKRDASEDQYNSYFFLSLSLATELVNAEKADIKKSVVLSYLRDGIIRWKSQMSAEINLEVYKVLYRLSSENTALYMAESHKWLLIKMEADHLKRLPRLLSQGRFFLVFHYYFESMEFWGLPSDITSKELSAQANLAPEQKRRLTIEWKAGGGVMPSPLIKQGQRFSVSSRFIILGSYLFSAPNDQDAGFDAERHAFDESAKSVIADLFDLIIDLPNLPAAIKGLMRSHSQRLLSYTLPIN